MNKGIMMFGMQLEFNCHTQKIQNSLYIVIVFIILHPYLNENVIKIHFNIIYDL